MSSPQQQHSYNYPPPASSSQAQFHLHLPTGDTNPSSSSTLLSAASPSRDHPDTPYPAGDTEPEGDGDNQGPPKKKRRRQALSCTECKRRKIKCDRAQPCGPCTRRGEQSKCQWHIVEPVEKYVTRAEYDDLKARLDQLESLVSQFLAAPPSMPSYQMGMHTPITSSGPQLQPYHSAPPSVPLVYHHPIMSSPSFPHPVESIQQQPPHRYSKPDSPQSPRHHQHQHHSAAPTMHHNPMSVTSTSPIIQTHPLSMNRIVRVPPPTELIKSPGGSIKQHQQHQQQQQQQHSPLSLASITAPFNPESQSKNYHAQTLIMLGERLRPESTVPPEGPASLMGVAPRTTPSPHLPPLHHSPQRPQTLRICSSRRLKLLHRRTRCQHLRRRRRVVSVTRLSSSPVLRRQPMTTVTA